MRSYVLFILLVIFMVGTCVSEDTSSTTTVTETSLLGTESGTEPGINIKKHHKKGHGKKHRRRKASTTAPPPVNTTHPMYVCYSDEQRALVEDIMTDHVFNGPIGYTEALAIKFAPEDQKKQLIMDVLEKYNLPPLPKCYNITTTTDRAAPVPTDVSPPLACSDPAYRQLVLDSLLRQVNSSDVAMTRSDVLTMFVDEEKPLDEIEEVLRAQNLSLPLECVVESDVTLSSGDSRDDDDDEGHDDGDDGEYDDMSENEIDACVDKLLSDPSSAVLNKEFRSSLGSGDGESIDLTSEDSRKKLKEALIRKVVPEDLCRSPVQSRNVIAVAEDAPPKPLNSLNNLSADEIKEGMEKLQMAVQKGYLPKDAITRIMHGEISIEWLKNNLTHNRAFIIDALPAKLQEFARNGTLDEKYIQLFGSGKSRAEIESILVEDDDFFYQFFPKILTDALQGKALPIWLKKSVLSGPEASGLQEMLFQNDTLCYDLFDEVTCVFLVLYSDPTNQKMNAAMNVLIYGLLVFIMLSMGLTIEYSKVVELVKKPKGIIIAFLAQFVFMPGAALGLTKFFGLEMFAALTILLIGCSPGGNISNLLAYIFDGDMNLSILMTCCSCILGLGLMPLNIFLWSQFITTSAEMIIPYTKIMISITITIIPVAIGSLIRNYKPEWVTRTRKIGFVFISLISVAVIGMAGYLFGDILIRYFPVELISSCALLPLFGYAFGFLFARIFGESYRSSRTIMIETGCQNAQLCAGILKLSFNPIRVGLYFLVPMVYMFLQVLEILIMVCFWKSFCRRSSRKYEVAEQDCEEKDRSETIGIRKSISSDLQMDDLSQNKRKSLIQDISEVWPLGGTPTESCLSSFQQAKSENFV